MRKPCIIAGPIIKNMLPPASTVLLLLGPDGSLSWHAEAPSAGDVSAATLRELEKAFACSAARGLLCLAERAGAETLPDSLLYWRGFVQEFLTRLCHIPRLREDGWQGGPALPDDAALDALIAAAPPLPGMEFLTRPVLAGIWLALSAAFTERVAQHRGDAGAVLAEINKSRRLQLAPSQTRAHRSA